jgi:hypothetical protein
MIRRNIMKNKLIILISILLVFVSIFAGCASKKEMSYDNATKAEAPRAEYDDGDFGAMEPASINEESVEDTVEAEATLDDPSKLSEKIIYTCITTMY